MPHRLGGQRRPSPTEFEGVRTDATAAT